MSDIATTAVAPATSSIELSFYLGSVDATANVITNNLQTHPSIVTYSNLFDKIVIKSITMRLFQARILDDDHTPSIWRFGITPRQINTVHPATGDNIIHTIPHLQMISTTDKGNNLTFTWGEGGVPFPPALQLDIRAPEVVHKHPELFFGLVSDPANANLIGFNIYVDCKLEMSGIGFGQVY